MEMTESEAIKEIRFNMSTIGLSDKAAKRVVEARNMAINALEKQIAKKPYKDNENGVYEKDHCPTCHRSLFPNDRHCECGQAIDWGDEE